MEESIKNIKLLTTDDLLNEEEYKIVSKYFPDFNKKDFEKCILEYSNRRRRFGKWDKKFLI